MLSGLNALHDANLIHRDLKLQNLLFNFPEHTLPDQQKEFDFLKNKFFAKITDFGCSKTLKEGET